MAGTTTTTDANDDIISIQTSPVVATINFARTVTFPNTFGAKEEFGIFLQVPLDDVSTPEAIESELAPQAALIKALVYKQLGLEAGVSEAGVITSAAQVGDAPKAKGGKAKGSTPAASAPLTDEAKTELWVRLAAATANGSNFKDGDETIWDNRVNKRNPKGPDFKWADSGDALWLRDAPDWFGEPGDGALI